MRLSLVKAWKWIIGGIRASERKEIEMKLPKIITHKNMEEFRKELFSFAKDPKNWEELKNPDFWGNQGVTLEYPIGEIAESFTKTLVLTNNGAKPNVVSLSGKEGFNAQGLEGKCRVRKPLVQALIALAMTSPFRGRIVTDKGGEL